MSTAGVCLLFKLVKCVRRSSFPSCNSSDIFSSRCVVRQRSALWSMIHGVALHCCGLLSDTCGVFILRVYLHKILVKRWALCVFIDMGRRVCSPSLYDRVHDNSNYAHVQNEASVRFAYSERLYVNICTVNVWAAIRCPEENVYMYSLIQSDLQLI